LGLNLKIKRIIFATLTKFDGIAQRALLPPEIKQLAGRAGRFGMGSDSGGVTCLKEQDMHLLRESLKARVVDIKQCGVSPTLDQIALYIEARPGISLVGALEAFHSDAQVP
jgi:ATP-dependent RNA helicase SUPV3L1/SUV3